MSIKFSDKINLLVNKLKNNVREINLFSARLKNMKFEKSWFFVGSTVTSGKAELQNFGLGNVHFARINWVLTDEIDTGLLS